MKKLINTSFLYLILALAAGVFYREFTKFNGFTGRTTLGVIHTHLFVLGVLLFLILALFANSRPDILENRRAKTFYIMQNISLILFSAALLVRGIMQVLNIQLSAAANSTISGIAGVTHIMLTISLVLFFLLLKSVSKEAAVE